MKAINHTIVRTLCETVVVLIIGLLAGFVNNALSSRGIPLVGRWDRVYGLPSPGGIHDPTRGNIEIGLGDALRLFKEGAVFLDARPDEAYAEGRIHGAYSLPEKKLAALLEEALAMLEGAQRIVVYCQNMECDEAHLVAKTLREAGLKEIVVFAGGMKEWESAGCPVDRTGAEGGSVEGPGAPAESEEKQP
jgi:rhodanese-related sulfurtransferase